MSACSPCPFNVKRLVSGAIAGGLWIFAVEFVTHVKILGERYASLTEMGHYLKDPRIPFMPIHAATCLIVALCLAIAYASSRDTLKPGPCTAMKVGGLIAVIASATYVAMFAWSAVGKFIPVVYTAAMFAECIGATLIAGAIYKPKADGVPPA